MRKTRILIGIAAGALALSSCQKQEAHEGTKPVAVITMKVGEEPQRRTASVTGDISARVQSDLSFRVSGRIIERFVDVGSVVKAGEILARIDPEEQRADVAVAQANLNSAKATELQAQLAFQRQQNLFTSNVTTQAALDSAQETLTTAEGSVASAQASLDSALDSLSYTELRADADGIITARDAEVGQVAQAAQAVFSLAHDGPRDAVFDVYESLYLHRAPGDEVKVSLLSDPRRTVMAKVREISPSIDTSTGTIRVKVNIEQSANLPLGAPVVGTFQSDTFTKMELPWSAMASIGSKPAVWVFDPASSTASLHPIEVAAYETGNFQVTSGIKPGDMVVIDGLKFIRPGEKLTSVEMKHQ
ncbi:efflux RND transporter periplasmic adaptor subunit [Rhizobium paknamense]|uniref:RND family efflux transporter MFP subunit n=1 Tax=Rhizobium paknamense TaxID=1206817 RepID=A0ABU0IEP1_9HYPH|nr:efflux RND transporter periplasmic adaptor subunit [Rhizobium paknamense]MDQ0456113.1 RND family efflux transporter MFP subunit [Rhizobium paknamense]